MGSAPTSGPFGTKGAGGSTFFGSSANPVGAALAQTGLSEKEQKNLGLVLDPGGALTEETFFKSPETLEPPSPPGMELSGEEQIQAAAKKKREFERIRRAGTQGRQSTIKTGAQGASPNIQTTFKQLRGR